MSEYWKSTPKYWCKHCAVFVRDTKLERANHEATGKHQGAIKRSLRDIHRNAEQKERDKERARREVDRLNGVVSKTTSSSSSGSKPTSGGAYGAPPVQKQMTEAERQRQLEQLAELGVNIPTELRGTMAMAGEWTVTNVRVVDEGSKQDVDDRQEGTNEARAMGVKRERERTEEEREQEEAIKGLFNKRRKWGVGSKRVEEADEELDKLLSGPLAKVAKKEEEVKKEEPQEDIPIKQEADEAEVPEEAKEPLPEIKNEPGEEAPGDDPLGGVAEVKDEAAVVFKKRKPKNIRQK